VKTIQMAETNQPVTPKSLATELQIDDTQQHKEINVIITELSVSEDPTESDVILEKKKKFLNKLKKFAIISKVNDIDKNDIQISEGEDLTAQRRAKHNSHIETNIEIAETGGPEKKPRIKKSFFKRVKSKVDEDDEIVEVVGSESYTNTQTPKNEQNANEKDEDPTTDRQTEDMEPQPKKTFVEKMVTIQVRYL
jgi:hypothetical protein